MKKTLVLGGTRFIGYHLVHALHRQGHNVTVFNRQVTRPSGPLGADIRRIRGDRNDPKDIRRLFSQDFDVVFDLSGLGPHHVGPVVKYGSGRIGHYIFCSTSSVHSVPPPCPFDETSPRFFTPGTYGGDKASAEEMLLNWSATTGQAVTIIRPQGVFGPYDAHHAGFVFDRLFNSLPIPVRAGSGGRVNLLFVCDLVRAFVLAMDNPVSQGRVYCVAGDEVVSQPEFIRLCGRVASREPLLVYLGRSAYAGLKLKAPWLGYDLVAANGRIKTGLGISFTPLAEALSQTLRWWESQPGRDRRCRVRGDRYVLGNRPVPAPARALWKLGDAGAGIVTAVRRRPWLRRTRLYKAVLAAVSAKRRIGAELSTGHT